MGHGSTLCAKLHVRIVSQFKDNVSQCKLARNLGLSPSTVHNFVKRFRESGVISVRKGQGRKLLLNAHDHRALRWYCLSHMGLGVLWKIIVTQHRCILFIYSFSAEMPLSSLGPKSSEIDRKTVETCKSTFQLVFGKNRRRILLAKDDPDCYQQKVQKPASVILWGCISAHGMGDLHICEGTIDAETYVGILERHMLLSRRQLFPGTRPILAGQCQGQRWQKLIIV